MIHQFHVACADLFGGLKEIFNVFNKSELVLHSKKHQNIFFIIKFQPMVFLYLYYLLIESLKIRNLERNRYK